MITLKLYIQYPQIIFHPPECNVSKGSKNAAMQTKASDVSIILLLRGTTLLQDQLTLLMNPLTLISRTPAALLSTTIDNKISPPRILITPSLPPQQRLPPHLKQETGRFKNGRLSRKGHMIGLMSP